MVNLISAYEIENFLRNGFVGQFDLSEGLQKKRRALARTEMAHFAGIIDQDASEFRSVSSAILYLTPASRFFVSPNGTCW